MLINIGDKLWLDHEVIVRISHSEACGDSELEKLGCPIPPKPEPCVTIEATTDVRFYLFPMPSHEDAKTAADALAAMVNLYHERELQS